MVEDAIKTKHVDFKRKTQNGPIAINTKTEQNDTAYMDHTIANHLLLIIIGESGVGCNASRL